MASEIDQLRETIAVLENQRAALGDAVVDSAVGPLRERLAGLTTPEQRKLVAILFADLVDFTPLSERMDPEDVREVMNSYFGRWSRCIEVHDGTIEKFIGDAVMAVFGLATAREDDTERAIRAALAMQDMLSPLNDELEGEWGLRVAMRVGINTGVVVVGLLGDQRVQDVGVLGDAVNLAARLQTAAPVNGILISHASYQHVRGVFEVEPLGPIVVKGKHEPIAVYLVSSAVPRAFRVTTRGVEGVETPMVGRDSELARLQELVASAREDRERVMATVIGEAGIGKSRLMYEFDTWLGQSEQPAVVLTGRGSGERADRPFGLIRDALEHHFEIQDTDPPEVVLEKLTTGMAISRSPDQPLDDGPELVGWLLGFDLGLPAPASPEEARDRGLARLLQFLEELTVTGLVVILTEDIHWADDASLDILKRLMTGAGPGLPIQTRTAKGALVAVATTRPGLLDRRPQWAEGEEFHSLISLEPLSKHQTRRLVAEVLSRVDEIPAELRDLVVTNAEGNPFYVEELVKMLIGDGIIVTTGDRWVVQTGAITGLRVPPTLTGVLQARFDALARPEQLALQQASVIGRVFWDGAVGHLGDEEDTAEVLSSLRDREMIQVREASAFGGSREYIFQHALLREVVYDSLPKRRRQNYHRRAAGWLEGVTAQTGRVEEYASQIADNYALAGESAVASGWYRRAGDRAAAQFANREALAMFDRALDLAHNDDDGFRFDVVIGRSRVREVIGDHEANRHEVDTLLSLATRLDDRRQAQAHHQAARYVGARGRLAEAVSHAQTARRFAQQAGDVALEAWALDEWGNALWKQAELEPARRITEETIEVVRGEGLALIEAHLLRRMGLIAELEGRHPEMRTYYEEALRRYRLLGSRREVSRILNDLGVGALKQSDLTAARSYLTAALDLKREIGDRVGESVVRNNLAIVSHNLGDLESAMTEYREVFALSTELDDPEGIAAGQQGMGVLAAAFGRYQEARQWLVEACDRYQESNDREGLSGCLSDLATTALGQGDAQEAQALAERAAGHAQEAGLAIEEAYARLLVGQARLATGHRDEAVRDLRHVVDDFSGLVPALDLTARAALAEALVGDGKTGEGAELARETLALIEAGPVAGLTDPVAVLLACRAALLAAADPDADRIVAVAAGLLETMAGRIDDPGLRSSFVNEVASHRRLAELAPHD